MQIHDINDYYRPKRFPWLPVTLIAIAVIAGGLYAYSKWGNTTMPDQDSTLTDIPTAVQGSGAIGLSDSSAKSTSLPVSTKTLAPVPMPLNPLPTAQIDTALAECRNLEAEDKLEAAREKYLSILDRTGGNVRPQIEAAIGRLSIELITSPRPMVGKVEYVIKSGDSLSKIAAKFNCPVLLIQKANRIADPMRIRPGDRLILSDHPDFSVLVSKSQNTLSLLLGGRLFKIYSVGTGVHSKTPVGTFRIADKIAEPPWWPSDGRATIPFGSPENILGTHWLALEATGDTPKLRGYGIHGTWDDSSIGKQSSAGCVRMKNAEVGEIFMLLPRNTPVTIVE